LKTDKTQAEGKMIAHNSILSGTYKRRKRKRKSDTTGEKEQQTPMTKENDGIE
jgi:hypothetical protein